MSLGKVSVCPWEDMCWSKGNNFREWVHFAAVMSQNQQMGAGWNTAEAGEKCKQHSLRYTEYSSVADPVTSLHGTEGSSTRLTFRVKRFQSLDSHILNPSELCVALT